MTIRKDFRASMNWFHTWLGIALSGVLFVIFWMGTLSVFDFEIDRWMMPEIRPVVDVEGSIDPIIRPRLAGMTLDGSSTIVIIPATERTPYIRLIETGVDVQRQEHFLHPESGEEIERTNTLGASGFFYPFHFSLHITWRGLGQWIVGLASMAMLLLIVSGTVIHRKILQDFFTFRPHKSSRRSSLDLHNMTSIVALPFHILFPLSGVLILAFVYFSDELETGYGGNRAALVEDVFGLFVPKTLGLRSDIPKSIDRFIADAERIWTQRSGMSSRADVIRVVNAGDSNSIVIVEQQFPAREVAMAAGIITYHASTGELKSDALPKQIQRAVMWLQGAHFMRFDSWVVRWLFFLGGLSGSVMIATGLIFWMQSRIKKTAEATAIRVVRALCVGTVTGVIAASIAFLASNRMLSNETTVFGFGRHGLEVAAFFAVWVVCFVHAGIRGIHAWADQCWVIAALALFAVVMNWASTEEQLLNAAMKAQWAVVGVDLALLSSAALATYSGRLLRRSMNRHTVAEAPPLAELSEGHKA